MLACCESQVGQVLSQRDGKLKSDIIKVCRKKTQISPDFISNLVADQVLTIGQLVKRAHSVQVLGSL